MPLEPLALRELRRSFGRAARLALALQMYLRQLAQLFGRLQQGLFGVASEAVKRRVAH
jgi:hypothetical protein